MKYVFVFFGRKLFLWEKDEESVDRWIMAVFAPR